MSGGVLLPLEVGVLGLPLFLALGEVVAAQLGSGVRRAGIVLFALALLGVMSGPLLSAEGGAPSVLRYGWAAGLGFELRWSLTPAWAGLLFLSTWAWWRGVRDSSGAHATSLHLLVFGATLAVGSQDLLSAVGAMACIAWAGLGLARAGSTVGRWSAAQLSSKAGLGMSVGLAAGLALCLSTGMASQAASHEHWQFAYLELAEYVFPTGVQQQNVLLLLIFVGPFAALAPLGLVPRRIVDGHAFDGALAWRLLPLLAASAIWSRGVSVLARRVAPAWAAELILYFVLAASVWVLVERGRLARAFESECGDAPSASISGLVFLPLVFAAPLFVTGTPWGAYALWLALAGHILAAHLEGEDSLAGHYLQSGAPGSLYFAALVASWIAMRESIATLTPSQAATSGALLLLPLVLSLRPLLGRPLPKVSTTLGANRALVLLSLALGLIGGNLVAALSPLEVNRADEFTFLRCAEHELADLRRPRLLSEMSLGCVDPAGELERAFGKVEVQEAPQVTTTELVSTNPPPQGEAP